jgi:hypothetical protein
MYDYRNNNAARLRWYLRLCVVAVLWNRTTLLGDYDALHLVIWFECSIAIVPFCTFVDCGSEHSWMCLYCGDVRCGRYANKHALTHFEHFRSHVVLFDCDVYSVYW